jgi:DNA-binding response OmpR family regulator
LSGVIERPKTVLVVEDEILIRMGVIDPLAAAGFAVIEANGADEALAVLHEKAAGVHLLFTDVNMPGSMSGLQLAHHVRRSWPPIALLITSGASALVASDMPAGARFLAKPYDPDHVVDHARILIAQDLCGIAGEDRCKRTPA